MTSPSEPPEPSPAGPAEGAPGHPGPPDATPGAGIRRRDIRARRGEPAEGEATSETVAEEASTAVGSPASAAAGRESPTGAIPAAGVGADPDEQEPNGEPGEGPEEPESGAGAPTGGSRRRLVIIIGAVVGLLVVALVALLLTQSSGRRDPMNVVTITHQAEPPTPEVDPIERDTSTSLLEALPDVVLAYAVTEQTESTTMLEAFALEGWTLTYTGAEGEIVLQVGQWPTDSEAQRVFEGMVGEAAATAEGDVLVDGEAVGTFAVQEVDGAERTIWRNGTAVFVAEGANGTTHAFYEAFPF